MRDSKCPSESQGEKPQKSSLQTAFVGSPFCRTLRKCISVVKSLVLNILYGNARKLKHHLMKARGYHK